MGMRFFKEKESEFEMMKSLYELDCLNEIGLRDFISKLLMELKKRDEEE